MDAGEKVGLPSPFTTSGMLLPNWGPRTTDRARPSEGQKGGCGGPPWGRGEGHPVPDIFLWAFQGRFLGRFHASEGAEVLLQLGMATSRGFSPAMILWIEKRPGSCS